MIAIDPHRAPRACVPSREGVALFAALGLMAIIALLIGGTFASTRLAQRSSNLSHADALLMAAAEYALNSVLAEARAKNLYSLPLGVGVLVGGEANHIGAIATTVVATRLPRGVVWLVAEARETGGRTGRRRLNLVARFSTSGALPEAGIVARGNVRIAPGVTFAADTAGDAECRASLGGADVMVDPGSEVRASDSVRIARSTPKADSAIESMISHQLARLDASTGFVRVRGDTTITTGTVDGVLYVEGALVITGSLTVSGIVIARGPIDARAGRLDVTGSLVSTAPRLAEHEAVNIGVGSIHHSPCTVARVLRRITPFRPVNGRSWAELF